jgi:pyridoxine 5-phosphate synthase
MNMKKILLGVNIDHIATLRQVRGTRYPDPLNAALVVEAAGADGLTLHLREDRRHIQDEDVKKIREAISIPMNFEMAVTEEMLTFAEQIKPAKVCLVPEKREELTTEGGLDVLGNFETIKAACIRLAKSDIEVSLFIDPDPTQIKAAYDTGAPVIEIHTGAYAELEESPEQDTEFKRISDASTMASKLGLIVNAGHGLHYENTDRIAKIPEINELNIGHAIVAEALWVGLDVAVCEMKCLMNTARQEK